LILTDEANLAGRDFLVAANVFDGRDG